MTTVLSTITGTHPYADKFPMLSEPEMDELAESIRANGLRNPVVVTPDGLVLDGRNRVACCERLGIVPETVIYDRDDLAEYVIDCNVTRRNLTAGQRAMATALVLSMDGRRRNGRWQYGKVRESFATKDSNALAVAVSKCGLILDHAADLAAQVVSGDLGLDAAYHKAEQNRDAEKTRLAREAAFAAEEAEAREFITTNAPDLAEQVGSAFQTYAEALAVWQKRNREQAERIAEEKRAEERKQKELRHGWERGCTAIAESVRHLSGGRETADIFLRSAYPHESEFLPPQLRLTVENLTEAIEYLTRLREVVSP